MPLYMGDMGHLPQSLGTGSLQDLEDVGRPHIVECLAVERTFGCLSWITRLNSLLYVDIGAVAICNFPRGSNVTGLRPFSSNNTYARFIQVSY